MKVKLWVQWNVQHAQHYSNLVEYEELTTIQTKTNVPELWGVARLLLTQVTFDWIHIPRGWMYSRESVKAVDFSAGVYSSRSSSNSSRLKIRRETLKCAVINADSTSSNVNRWGKCLERIRTSTFDLNGQRSSPEAEGDLKSKLLSKGASVV